MDALERIRRHVVTDDPGTVVGLYHYGSAVIGGLRPDSDLDLLLVTERTLTSEHRRGLLRPLLDYSGRRALVAPGRPIDLTSITLGDLTPWRYPPACDFLYGEWLRDEHSHGNLPSRHTNPDLAIIVTTARQHATVLHGEQPRHVLPTVPRAHIDRCIVDSLPALLDDLTGDERNVLLTLARMLVTLQSGDIVSKDEAARRLLPTLPQPDRGTLELAARAYLGRAEDDWRSHHSAAAHTAATLAHEIDATAP